MYRFYQMLSAEAYSKHGFNIIHAVVFDDLHTKLNRKLFDVMTKDPGAMPKYSRYTVWLQLLETMRT